MAGRSLIFFAFMISTTAAAYLPDPTRPPDFQAQEMVVLPKNAAAWEVSGITISGRAASAILNNQVVVPGQSVGEATVLKIVPGKVVLDYAGQRLDVHLQTRTVKRLRQ